MKLRVCPFCGGIPYIEESSRGFVGGESTRVAYVRCRDCNARSERVPLSEYNATSCSAEATKRVIDKWNMRVPIAEYVDVLTKNERRKKNV